MWSWFRNRSFEDFESWQLPGDVGRVSLPKRFKVEIEDDRTLLAYPDEDSEISLRVTSISFVPKDPEENAAVRHVKERAAENGYVFEEVDGKGVASFEEESKEDGDSLLIRYWLIGDKCTLVILSATILRSALNARDVQETLKVMPRIVESVEITKTHEIVELDDGTKIETTVEPQESIEQTFRLFEKTEYEWLSKGLSEARRLSLRYGQGSTLDEEEMDGVFSAWMADESPEVDADLVADALGAAFGELLVHRHGFRWGVIEDQYGAENAVRHQRGDTTAFPRASVMKRIESRQPTFFREVYAIAVHQAETAE